MSGLAIIAKQQGFQVSGTDQHLILPVAEVLRKFDIDLYQGYAVDSLPADVDYVIIGNALSRGTPIIEHILNRGIPYCSGPEWLSRHVLANRWVLAVTGTHGKTTTASMLAWILEQAGYNPGFLIGGNANNFSTSARYTDAHFFVIEADEYDTAFFDKRSKFMHYQPRTLIINNLEFDHADIFANLEDIKKQFLNLLRIVPSNGLIIAPKQDEHVQSLFSRGCWTKVETFADEDADWLVSSIQPDGSEFKIVYAHQTCGTIKWNLMGAHNMQNALSAIAAARHVGILPHIAIKALCDFQGVKRRLQLKGVANNIHVYDDFAHHPTAIAATLAALRSRVGQQRIVAIVEFGSNTMRTGHHKETLPAAFTAADDVVLLCEQDLPWQSDMIAHFPKPVKHYASVDEIVAYLSHHCRAGDHVVCMSNKAFGGIHQKLLTQFQHHA